MYNSLNYAPCFLNDCILFFSPFKKLKVICAHSKKFVVEKDVKGKIKASNLSVPNLQR